MSILPVANSPAPTPNGTPAGGTPEKPVRPKKKGRSFAQIHAKPLPVDIHPLPAFHPTNPISLLRIAYTWISHILYQPTSHPGEPYIGYFSPETRSVHVTDPKHVRALWEMGFFGKGTLSRSEPSWLEREKARIMTEMRGHGGRKAAEDATNARREERRLFKLERARAERERTERQRLVERGELQPDESGGVEDIVVEPESKAEGEDSFVSDEQEVIESQPLLEANHVEPKRVDEVLEIEDFPEPQVDNQEHLQLTLEEAFFLSYGLGVLTILPPRATDSPPMSPKSLPKDYSNNDVLQLFCQHSSFPPSPTPSIAPDDQFLLNYVVYHHFRSLGWVVRPGMKFGCDYILYNRGPVFSHAEFAVMIVPAYSHRYWNSPGGRGQRRVAEQKDWWWLHCVNRVQSQVKKTLVLCYVEVPSPFEVNLEQGIGQTLACYRKQFPNFYG
ncbi:tRNA splicing endonuclease subunit sen2 [Extremus antarcticus]|uniref:tRNA-splicing endonuclease subunit Sen2 n=1 Tax=Extremus antarcticus TaxID=702011 RepID=A0AAJ0D770_9PEZI|nr:tRNA splicing endonuclease subunit sen2 [Extremus antarcticus]